MSTPRLAAPNTTMNFAPAGRRRPCGLFSFCSCAPRLEHTSHSVACRRKVENCFANERYETPPAAVEVRTRKPVQLDEHIKNLAPRHDGNTHDRGPDPGHAASLTARPVRAG